MGVIEDRTRHQVELQSLYRLVVEREMRKTDFILVQPLTAVPDIPEETALTATKTIDVSLKR